MDVAKFKNLINFLPFSGFCLSPEEAILIENSLLLLQNDQKLIKIFFWGKILTLGPQDYYIAFGYRKDCLKNRRFFYSQDKIQWTLLPTVNEDGKEASLIFNEMFQGDPGLVSDVKMQPKFEFINNRIEQVSCTIKKLKEEQRLACVVKMISDDTMIVPRGALYNDVNNLVTFNPTFSGLSREEAQELKNYQFYREPINKYNYNVLKRENYNLSTDFLDTLDSLIPVNKSISVTFERDGEIVVLKSLKWMGATFLHEIKSPLYGFCYVGDGKINHDLLFMT